MSALPWLLGGAAVGVGVLWWRSRQAEKETAPNPCKDIASATGIPEGACKLGLPIVQDLVQGVVDAVDAVAKTSGDVVKWDAENKALNGDVRIPNDAFYKALTRTCPDASTGKCYPAVDGTVVEFDNGCVPMSTSPNWAKCAPGTHNMLAYPILQAWWWLPDGDAKDANGSTSWKPDRIEPMTGSVRYEGESAPAYDPYTRGGITGAVNGAPFPIPIPDGHVGYLYKGRPFTCPKGSPPALRGANGEVIRDQRTNAPDYLPPCGSPTFDTRDQVGVPTGGGGGGGGDTWTPTDQLWASGGGSGGSGNVFTFQGQSTDIECTGDFVVDVTADGTKYCRRKRAGE